MDLVFETDIDYMTVDYDSSQLSKKINALQKEIGAKKKARD
jgi:hypothetical protein